MKASFNQILQDAHHTFAKLVASYVGCWPSVRDSLATVLAVFTLGSLIEIAAEGWNASALRKLVRPGPSARSDMVASFLLQTPATAHLGVAMSCGLMLWVIRTVNAHVVPWWPPGAHTGLRMLVCLLLVDLVGYALHRLMHASPLLWQLHRFHHAATEATLLTALRVHPLERACTTVCLAVPFALLGVHANDVSALFLATQVLAMLHHSNMTAHWGRLGTYALISPAAHRAHHAKDPAYFDCNFGALFPWWDHLFGTWREPATGAQAIGLEGDPLEASGWLASTWICYADFWRALQALASEAWRPRWRVRPKPEAPPAPLARFAGTGERPP